MLQARRLKKEAQENSKWEAQLRAAKFGRMADSIEGFIAELGEWVQLNQDLLEDEWFKQLEKTRQELETRIRVS